MFNDLRVPLPACRIAFVNILYDKLRVASSMFKELRVASPTCL